jgi:serine phosphatase RsbU (regulator of sigma subunit)
MYTDGVKEAVNAAGQQYGDRRVLEHVEAASGHPRQLVETIVDDVKGFLAGCAQADDMCLVCIKRN